MSDLSDYQGVKYEEGLPLPYVKYELGNFILEFGDSEEKFWICECFRNSIENYIQFQKDQKKEFYGENRWEEDFKNGSLSKYNMRLYGRYIKGIEYQSNICHRCNNKIPTLLNHHKMYGGKFSQTFGWYIKRRYWNPDLDDEERIIYEENESRMKVLEEEKKQLFDKHYPKNTKDYYGKDFRIPHHVFHRKREIEKETDRLYRRNMKMIENLVRGEFGYKPIGEMWVNETILYKLVKEIFPSSQVIHHYRGVELEGLEIDVFVKDKKIGFEYNGLQHYKPIKHFGGKKSLEMTKERDKRKKELCEKLGIELHIIKYDETITKGLIKSKMNTKNV